MSTDDELIVWSSKLDNKYTVEVTRTEPYRGELTVTDGSTVLHREPVGLSFDALFGPDVVVQWSAVPLPRQATVRVISKADRTGLVCTSELRPMGRIAMPFDSTAWHTEAVMRDDGTLLLTLYGPANYTVN